MTNLTRFDTNTLNRVFLGFDNLVNDFERRFSNQISNNYPPFNIVKTGENTFELEVAVTGFDKDEVTVEVDQNLLIVRGKKAKEEDERTRQYQHHGLASRDFYRTWTLAEYFEVKDASIKNGVLTIPLEKVIPESLKPRVLKITER